MAQYTYDDLIAELKKNQYIPKAQEDLAKEAAGRYDSVYAQKNLAAQQAVDASQLALDKQLNSLGAGYAKQREDSTKAYNNAYSQANRQSIKTGMLRSSYNLATLGKTATEGNKAQQDVNNAETTERTGIEGQKALHASQLARQLEQNAVDKTNDTNAYLDELLNREYERKTAAEDMQNTIYLQLLQLQQEQDKLDEEKRQFDRLHPMPTGSGNKGGSGGKGDGKGGGKGSSFAPYISFQERLNAIKLGYGYSDAAVAAMRVHLKNKTSAPASEILTGKKGLQE
jgi:hypothetical protein